MINYSINRNELILANALVKFNYPIYKVVEFDCLLIVLLEFKNSDNPKDFYNAVYAISDTEGIVWQMEDVKRVLGTFEPDPLVNLEVLDNNIIAVDFCSRKYTINPNNGIIQNVQTGRW